MIEYAQNTQLIGELTELDLDRRTGHVRVANREGRVGVVFQEKVTIKMKTAFALCTPVLFDGCYVDGIGGDLYDVWDISCLLSK